MERKEMIIHTQEGEYGTLYHVNFTEEELKKFRETHNVTDVWVY